MTRLKNHERHWLRPDAASAFDQWEENTFLDDTVVHIVQAGMSEEKHKTLLDRWNLGGEANRPPYFYEPEVSPDEAFFVRDGGVDVEVDEVYSSLLNETASDYGFSRVEGDRHIFTFTGIPFENSEVVFVEADA